MADYTGASDSEYSSRSSEGSDDSDLSDVPLFIPSAAPARPPPPGLSFGAPRGQEPATAASRGPPMPNFKLALSKGPGSGGGSSMSPEPARPHGGRGTAPDTATCLPTPENMAEPLPSSRTSKRPPMINALRLPPGGSAASRVSDPSDAVGANRGPSSSPAPLTAAAGGNKNTTAPVIPKLGFPGVPAPHSAPNADDSPPPTYRGGARGFVHASLSGNGITQGASAAQVPPQWQAKVGAVPRSLSTHAASIQVSLLSPAFVVPSPHQWDGSTLPRDLLVGVVQQVADSLGVDASSVHVFTVGPASASSGGSGPAEAPHLAVHVQGSSFSLTALEDLLAQNRQLQAAQTKNAETLGAMYNDLRAERDQAASLTAHATQQDARLAASEAARQQLVAEMDQLRLKLKECDADRQQLRSTIHDLRRHFREFLTVMPGAPPTTPPPVSHVIAAHAYVPT